MPHSLQFAVLCHAETFRYFMAVYMKLEVDGRKLEVDVIVIECELRIVMLTFIHIMNVKEKLTVECVWCWRADKL